MKMEEWYNVIACASVAERKYQEGVGVEGMTPKILRKTYFRLAKATYEIVNSSKKATTEAERAKMVTSIHVRTIHLIFSLLLFSSLTHLTLLL